MLPLGGPASLSSSSVLLALKITYNSIILLLLNVMDQKTMAKEVTSHTTIFYGRPSSSLSIPQMNAQEVAWWATLLLLQQNGIETDRWFIPSQDFCQSAKSHQIDMLPCSGNNNLSDCNQSGSQLQTVEMANNLFLIAHRNRSQFIQILSKPLRFTIILGYCEHGWKKLASAVSQHQADTQHYNTFRHTTLATKLVAGNGAGGGPMLHRI